jgi:outer membrane receptor protein involved in Fe transport
MKKIAMLSVVFLYSLNLLAQTGNLKGRVIHAATGEAIPFATVSLDSESKAIAQLGMICDENGRFDFRKVIFGTYNLNVRFIGFKPHSQTVQISRQNTDIDLGSIKLLATEIVLDDVEVVANTKTSSTSIDRKTYRVEDFGTARGGSAVDILNKLPSVSVDPDGTVSLRGTTDFLVYLNGKPTQQDASMILSQISGELIKKIEIITVPTARYDAQGKGGIINITTKGAGDQGWSLSVNGMLGGAPWGNRIDPFTDFELNDTRNNAGARIAYSKDKVSLYAGLNYNLKNVNGMRIGDARLLQSDGSYYHMVASGERPEWYKTNSFNAGLDYKLSDKATISVGLFSGTRLEGRSAFYVYHNFFADADKNDIPGINRQESWILNPNTDNRTGSFTSGSIDFSYDISETDQIFVSVLTEKSGLSRALTNQNLTYYPDAGLTGDVEAQYRQSDNTPLDGIRFSAEYQKTISENHSIRVGLQPQIFSIAGNFNYDIYNNRTGDWDSRDALENGIELSRNIYAAFVDYEGKSGQFDWAAGLRAEYTDQNLMVQNPEYFSIFERENKSEFLVQKLDLFPNLHLQYSTLKQGRFLLAASRRISRPPIKNMAPFLYRRHYEVYVVGDPDLKPEYLTNLELSYVRGSNNQSITLTGFYRGTDNAIFRVNTVYEEENVLIRSYTNSGNSQATGAELNGNLQLHPQVKLFMGASVYNYRLRADIFGFQEDNRSVNWSLKSNLNIFPIPQIRISGDIDIRSATVTAQGRDESFYMVNAALEYTPKKPKGWSVSLRGIDLLGSNITGLNTRAFNESGVQIFYQETQYVRYGPIVEIQMNYNLNWNNKKMSGGEYGNKEF